MDDVKIVIDIRFYGGSFKRGIVAHSIEFVHGEHWCLKVYKTQSDVFKNNPECYWGVEKIEVIGIKEVAHG